MPCFLSFLIFFFTIISWQPTQVFKRYFSQTMASQKGEPNLNKGVKRDYYPFQTGLKTRNVLRRTFRVHPRPLSVWKVTGWSPPGEHGTNSGWTRREIRARLSSTNTERPPEDVPCLPQTAASMKGLGTHTVCKPEPEIPRMNILVHVLCSFCMIIMHKIHVYIEWARVIRLPSNLEYMSIKFAQLFILTKYGQYWVIIWMSVARKYYNKGSLLYSFSFCWRQ